MTDLELLRKIAVRCLAYSALFLGMGFATVGLSPGLVVFVAPGIVCGLFHSLDSALPPR